MNGAACTVTTFEIGGKTYDRIPFTLDFDPNIRVCNDCGTLYGQLHHPLCDLEECPFCHQQAIACRHALPPMRGQRIITRAYLRR
jgi:hypothetical protein